MIIKYKSKDGTEHTGLVLQFLSRGPAPRPYAGAQAIILRDDNHLVTVAIGDDRANALPYDECDPLEVLPEPTAPQYNPTTGGMPS